MSSQPPLNSPRKLFNLPPALHHKRFVYLWLGLMISMAGSQMQLWALYWHIRSLSNQPIAVSGIGVVRFLPVLIFSLIAGLVADRFDRRKVMFLTQTAMALVALALGLLTLSGQVQIWHLYVLTGIQAIAGAFDLPARQALTPNLVPVKDLPSAFSMQSIAFDLGAIVGPGLSGIVIGYYGQSYTYLLNAVSFGAVIVALVLIGPVAQEFTPQPQQPSQSWMAIREGIDFILHQPIILASMILDFFATFFSSANTLLPFVAQDVLHVGPVPYGWLSAAQSMGAVTAAFIISQRVHIRRQGQIMLGAVTFFGLATALFGLSRSFFLTMFSLVLIGASDAVSTIIRNTIRQMQTPDYIRGRMTSVNQVFFLGGPQLGEIEAGLVAQAFSPSMAILTGGLGCIAAVAWIGRRWPQLRNYDDSELSVATAG
ncbi:MAG TPA: MFS transporter [Anaerolineaceae bacterium]|jgi:MFS family permease